MLAWSYIGVQNAQKFDGTTCREVTQSVNKNGQTQSQDVTLCRTEVAQADGSNWVIPQ